MGSKGAWEAEWGPEQDAEFVTQALLEAGQGRGAAQLEVGPLPGTAASKLLSPLWQGLLKVCLEPQTFPTHLSGWGTACSS